jgi:oligoribonuclease NrnB/cAMP/cGMP phosphodiesterase (DHH superfamily)
MTTLCIYHSECLDGFTAAWVVRRYFLRNSLPNVEFHAGVYNEPLPDVFGKDVILVDFSYKRELMEILVQCAKSVLVLDHHDSAMRDLAGFTAPNLTMFFDMERSGAMMAWHHFFPSENPPRLIRHVQDRDLWKFNLVNTKEIVAAVFSYAYTFENWDKLIQTATSALAVDGIPILRKHYKDIKELLPVVSRQMLIGGHVVWVANVPKTMGSDAAEIQHQHGQIFGAYYYDAEKHRVFGLRSGKGGIDVGAIAFSYGGGGHKSSSGFRIPIEDADKFELWNNKAEIEFITEV